MFLLIFPGLGAILSQGYPPGAYTGPPTSFPRPLPWGKDPGKEVAGKAQSNHFAKTQFVEQMNKLQKFTTYLGNNINTFIHKTKKLNLTM